MEPLLVRFKCEACEAVTVIAKRKVSLGLEFDCSECKLRYRVVRLHQNWTFAKLPQGTKQEPPVARDLLLGVMLE